MKWDRKLLMFGISVTAAMLVILGIAAFLTFGNIGSSHDRINARAAEGYESLAARLENPANISDLYSIARRGHYADRTLYMDFDVSVLGETVYVGGEYLADEIEYTHELEFHLRAYDTENVYGENDSISAYTKFTDSFTMLRSGEKYYVSYMSGGREYRFIVECPPLTEWIDSSGI